MRPEKLIISGWGPYKNRTEIDFTSFDGRGLFLITGATGAGKTTIFDAITYALYGSLSGETREKDSVRSDFADEATQTFVELFMNHGGKAYHIKRNPEYARPKKRGRGTLTKEKENAVLYLPDGGVLEGTKEVNARIQEILVLDYRQFKQITMIAQGEFARLLTAPPKEKTRIFRDIFGTGRYERFGQALRIRSNALYGKVSEQRNKLEEDVRLLLSGDRRQKATERLWTLTEGDKWNYGAIAEELQYLCTYAEKQEREMQADLKRMQSRNNELTRTVTEKKLQNEQIDKLLRKEEELQKLKEQAETMAEKKKCCVRAEAAEALTPYRNQVRDAAVLLQSVRNKLEELRKEQADLLEEKQKLAPLEAKREALWQYLESSRQLKESREQETACQKEYKAVIRKWENAKEAYLQAEAVRDAKRKAYEEADRIYRHAMVGLVARMLRPGEPCPVCGSMEHPQPAGEEPGLPSETELKLLQEEADGAEALLREKQEDATAKKTLAEEYKKRLDALRAQSVLLAQAEEAAGKGQFDEAIFAESGFMSASHQEKERFLQEKTERLTRLGTMLSALEGRLLQAGEELKQREKEKDAGQSALKEAMKKKGFVSEEQCSEALLSKQELKELKARIEDYEGRLAEASHVKSHLEVTLQKKKKQDLTALEAQTLACREELEEKQHLLKTAHAFCEEVKKTAAQFAIKRTKIEKAEEEYGYVKDLDNLASGLNEKKLVFEQYVLAGYFEEILRAANLRFFKMTGGRYEMSRVEEAEDGRTKDSLEIQVMDYYTGKSRSIKTLSGGESFKASLSLALGMSDVIQAMNGGIKVDTLFIDEGFGALDAESLEQACETLMGLVEHDNLIGIISHVPELRERIDCQLVVDKTNNGSSVKIRV